MEGCWHPDYIKNWTPANDVDAKFNRSTVALQPRFQDLTLKANPYQFYDGKGFGLFNNESDV